MGRRWHYLDPVQHIVLFNRHNLARLLVQAGFEVIATTTFGHYYRVGYILDRLKYLHADSKLGALLPVVATLAKPIAGAKLYLNLRDVLGITARKLA